MKSFWKRAVQLISLLIFQTVVMLIVAWLLPDFSFTSIWALLAMAIAFAVAQGIFWRVFIRFFSWLPVWLYPIITFVVNGVIIYWVGNLVKGISIANVGTAIWITIWVTAVNAVLGALFSLDEDEQFDRTITFPMVQRKAKPVHTDVPGFVFLEIDGLGEEALRHGLARGKMPTVQRWLDSGSHCLRGWETDYSSQTGAMQTGILQGSNEDIPAYRWYDRRRRGMVIVGSPTHSKDIEARLTNHHGLLSDGGASRGNMFSGDATESLFTFSTLLDRTRATGPGFYMFLVSPYVLARLVSRFVNECVREWWEAFLQRRRKDKYIITARDFKYGFIRGFMSPILQDLTTYTIITDILRGVPAMYALYGGYDDLAHFAGKDTPEANQALAELDRYFARVERAVAQAPRPYHIVVLADHGQSSGPTFKAAYGRELKEVVQGLVSGDAQIAAELNTDEAWDNLNAVLTETVNSNTRVAGIVRRMVRSKEADGSVQESPTGGIRDEDPAAAHAEVVVYASGCAGLVYFTGHEERLTYEQIQDAHPNLIIGLINHPGVGFVMVKSAQYGTMVVGTNGIHYLDDDKVEGKDPLAVFTPNAVRHLRRETGFVDCPDLLVNTAYDPVSEELPGFENQASHHGGLGGPQNFPFLLHPAALPVKDEPILGAPALHRVLRGWREQIQGIEPAPDGSTSGAGNGRVRS
jgi:uncharacterized membrane protein YvlD (DUF360 family)